MSGAARLSAASRSTAPGGRQCVGVEQERVAAPALRKRRVDCGGEAEIACVANQPEWRRIRGCCVVEPGRQRRIGRSVVDDDDLVGAGRRRGGERLQAEAGRLVVLVDRNDDGEAGRRRVPRRRRGLRPRSRCAAGIEAEGEAVGSSQCEGDPVGRKTLDRHLGGGEVGPSERMIGVGVERKPSRSVGVARLDVERAAAGPGDPAGNAVGAAPQPMGDSRSEFDQDRKRLAVRRPRRRRRGRRRARLRKARLVIAPGERGGVESGIARVERQRGGEVALRRCKPPRRPVRPRAAPKVARLRDPRAAAPVGEGERGFRAACAEVGCGVAAQGADPGAQGRRRIGAATIGCIQGRESARAQSWLRQQPRVVKSASRVRRHSLKRGQSESLRMSFGVAVRRCDESTRRKINGDSPQL